MFIDETENQMTKDEFRRERRKWRMILRSSFPDIKITDKSDWSTVRDFLWYATYSAIPDWYWECEQIKNKHCYALEETIAAPMMNHRYAHNSYPLKTKNP